MIFWIILHLSVTMYMTGIVWFVQTVHYPLFLKVPDQARAMYCVAHVRLTSPVVIIPALIEISTACWIVYKEEFLWLWTANFLMLILIWISTFTLQVPFHKALMSSGGREDAKWLVRTNWIRTVLWTVRGGLVFYLLYLSLGT